ncbi:MAG: restriction endonuclease subunit S [Collinsella sp.]|nr:restriction endonuclease subunit S [Collinsella sp.]
MRGYGIRIAVGSQLNGYLADAVDGLFEKALGQAEEKTLTDVVEILSGGTPRTKISEYWEDGEIPFFGPGDANGSTYCLTTAKRITQLGLENCNSELYPVDTVFLTARGTVGKVAMAGKPMAMNQSCFAFRGLGISQPAAYQIIKRAVRSLKAKANGATFAAINTRDLKIEEILVPSDEELTAFEEEAASLHSMMRVNEEESLKLSSLRDALLPKLMTGEIDVSELDLKQLNSHLA